MADSLLALGVALFFGGLVSGFLIPALKIPRMGLTSHLEGTANGTFLIVLGLIWDRLILGGFWEHLAFWTLVYGTWANWLATLLGAAWGTGKVSPIASGGVTGKPLHESIVTTMLIATGVADVVGVIIVFVGLVR